MTPRTFRYSAGNEHNPTDPFGRTELVIHPDGRARVDHHFPGHQGTRVWTGRVGAETLTALWAALDRAGFPSAPPLQLVPDATVRNLTVEAGPGDAQAGPVAGQASFDYHRAASLPGYGDAFGLLDHVISQLSGGGAARARKP